jgi:23S rRNA (cytidine1920-2'-O)/16S rRNA (cytidine1409-2'-O)-methyltransferase
MEGTNILNVPCGELSPAPDFFSVDVSFVSLKNIIPKLAEFMGCDGEAVILIKPQFEAGRANIGKNGIVKDKKVHGAVINDILSFCTLNGLAAAGVDFSPVSGGDGNIEYLAHITIDKSKAVYFDITKIMQIVNAAFSKLKGKDNALK